MFSKSKIVGSLLGLGFFLVLTPTIGLAEAVRPCGANLRNFHERGCTCGSKFRVPHAQSAQPSCTKAIRFAACMTKEGVPRCSIAQIKGLHQRHFLRSPACTRTKMDMSASAQKQTSQFQKIEQPIGLKLAVALGSLGLIGAELWWFMFSGRSFKVPSKRWPPSEIAKTKS